MTHLALDARRHHPVRLFCSLLRANELEDVRQDFLTRNHGLCLFVGRTPQAFGQHVALNGWWGERHGRKGGAGFVEKWGAEISAEEASIIEESSRCSRRPLGARFGRGSGMNTCTPSRKWCGAWVGYRALHGRVDLGFWGEAASERCVCECAAVEAATCPRLSAPACSPCGFLG